MCDDEVECTVDICNIGGCSNTPENSLCNDDIGCTNDVCHPTTGCEHEPVNALCSDGYDCTAECCNVTTGCIVDFANCPVEDKKLCINCKSAFTRFEYFELTDDTGALKLKSRIQKPINNIVSSSNPDEYITNVELFNGHFTIGDGLSIPSASDTAIINSGEFRIQVQEIDEEQTCNDITRGQIRIEDHASQDNIYLCVRTISGYQWKKIN